MDNLQALEQRIFREEAWFNVRNVPLNITNRKQKYKISAYSFLVTFSRDVGLYFLLKIFDKAYWNFSSSNKSLSMCFK